MFFIVSRLLFRHIFPAPENSVDDTIERFFILCRSGLHDVRAWKSVRKCACIASGSSLFRQQNKGMRGFPPDGYFIPDKYSSAQSPPAVRRSKTPFSARLITAFLEAQPNATSNNLAHVNSPPGIGNDVVFCQRYSSHGGKETIPARSSGGVRRPARRQPSEKIFASTPAAMPRRTAHWVRGNSLVNSLQQDVRVRRTRSGGLLPTHAQSDTHTHTRAHKSWPTMTRVVVCGGAPYFRWTSP